jgi:hypothetical protein
MPEELEVKLDLIKEEFSIGEDVAELVPLRAHCREVTLKPEAYEGQGHTISIKYVDGRGKTNYEVADAAEKDKLSIIKIKRENMSIHLRKEKQNETSYGVGFDSIIDIEFFRHANINIISGYKERE